MASRRLDRRALLRGAALATVALAGGHVPRARARTRGPQIFGVGRIGEPIAGKTIPSPSDFGFAADREGGTFVCSMFGDTAGFKGCDIMTVQGHVTPGSLQIHRRSASFAGEVGIFLSPNIFSPGREPTLSIAFTPMTVEVTLGGPGKASMVLHIPAVTDTLGGNTGGMLALGRIDRGKVRT